MMEFWIVTLILVSLQWIKLINETTQRVKDGDGYDDIEIYSYLWSWLYEKDNKLGWMHPRSSHALWTNDHFHWNLHVIALTVCFKRNWHLAWFELWIFECRSWARMNLIGWPMFIYLLIYLLIFVCLF